MEAHQNFEVSLRYLAYTMVKAKDFKFITQLGFAKAHHITTSRGKVGVAFQFIVIASSTSPCIEGKIRRNCFIIYIVGYFKNLDHVKM